MVPGNSRHLGYILVLPVLLMLMVGCVTVTTPAVPDVALPRSADLAGFFEQLAREALAAFLF